MQDNVRRQSITKKISFHQKHHKPYRTIESLEKAPTRKKINLNQHLKKQSHAVISSHSRQPERKAKSLPRHDPRKQDSDKRKSVLGNYSDLETIQGLIHRNIQPFKFSISRDRERMVNKQKYKRSEQIRSVVDHKKMSSISKIQRKGTQPSHRLQHIYSSINTEQKMSQKKKEPFCDIGLDQLINTAEGQQNEVTLQDVFDTGCILFYEYLTQKEAKLSQTNNAKTPYLKQVKQSLSVLLERSNHKFKTILKEVGQMSFKNIVMLALVKYEQGQHGDTILYLGKVYDKTEGNLMLIDLPGPDLQPNNTITLLSSTQPPQNRNKHCKLNLLAYLYLAQSYKQTSNYLCAINVLLKWQTSSTRPTHKKSISFNFKRQYQTLQSKDLQQQRQKPEHRIKKKSYLLTNLQPDITTNKFKKYSNVYNHSSIEFTKSQKKLESEHRHKYVSQMEGEERMKTISNHQESVPVLYDAIQPLERGEYEKEMTDIYLLLSRLYIKVKNYQTACNYYKKCLTHNPRKVEAILELASIYCSKNNPQKCLEWLQSALTNFEGSVQTQTFLDICYIKYHKSLVLLQQGKLIQSQSVLSQINAKQLQSQVNYYKGLIEVKLMHQNTGATIAYKNKTLQSILMHFNQAIACYTSKEYLIKSYFQILLVLLFEKKDYYGAQYEVNRFKKKLPVKVESRNREDEDISLSRISRGFEDAEGQSEQLVTNSLSDHYFNIIFDIIDGVICILKMKVSKGLSIFRQLSLKIQTQGSQLSRHFGTYYRQIVKLTHQFKFYSYYIQRNYELSLRNINKLLQLTNKQPSQDVDPQVQSLNQTDLKLISINKLMLQCMVLMKQDKFNYAMSKLCEIEKIMNGGEQGVSSSLVVNNFNMVKAICYVNLYVQLEREGREVKEVREENKEILLSAEELLRHCLMSDKENSLIYYLISGIHYQLNQFQSSLKYIRQALQYSDDHMIKHYFCKANTKVMLGRYDQAIKDYSNAIIVFKQQIKTQSTQNKIKQPISSFRQEDTDDYYVEPQIMINEIYLNRAIAYIKESYVLSKNKDYSQNVNVILSYRIKANDDLNKYFQAVVANNISLNAQSSLRDKLLLFLHTDDPSIILEVSKKLQPKIQLLKDQDRIKAYYMIKELNNCISHLIAYLNKVQQEYHAKEQPKNKKEGMPPKYRKGSAANARKSSQLSMECQKINKLRFDLVCLEVLKKTSTKTQQALEQSLITLLELTEDIYKMHEEELQRMSSNQNLSYTLEQLFINDCGQIFRWSDVLFFIGVIHFELREYETAIKYFEESYNQKKMSNSLYSLQKYLYPLLSRQNSSNQEEQIFSELEPLFQNRIYCKQELEYNIGVCYLYLKKYKQAYFYLQNYNPFLKIIKKSITTQTFNECQNQFMTEQSGRSKRKYRQRLISEHSQNQTQERDSKSFRLNKESRENLKNKSSRLDFKESSMEYDEEESPRQSENGVSNITPFPIRNRLCSIYSSKTIDDQHFYLSFCLPKIVLPTLGIFYEEETEVGKISRKKQQDQSSFSSSSTEYRQSEQQKPNLFPIQKQSFESCVNHISLLDLQMKPIAPWIKQNTCGVIFTQNIVNQSVQLNSSRVDKKKDKKDHKDGIKKGKNDRYSKKQ